MKERPILFNGAMVRAIRAGQKTVTRRALKVQPHIDASGNFCVGNSNYGQDLNGRPVTKHFAKQHCPYGQPGDRLWVRETFADIGARLTYRADLDDGAHCLVKRWTPSLHMPRAACRLLLEITAVRVERLQAISRADIRAEGLQCPPELASDDVTPNYRDWYPMAFRALWESTGGDWAGNPWVWVVEFRPVPAEALAAGEAA